MNLRFPFLFGMPKTRTEKNDHIVVKNWTSNGALVGGRWTSHWSHWPPVELVQGERWRNTSVVLVKSTRMDDLSALETFGTLFRRSD